MAENKVIVLTKEGQWLELKNSFLVGAVEYPDKVVYHKFLFSQCDQETLDEMLKKAEQFLAEQKKERK
ncbi:MAG: hypothetical protein Q8O05_03435 [Chloroflexota bacterium]|nr:hypothetical protein [Chloroflexota bacterium]